MISCGFERVCYCLPEIYTKVHFMETFLRAVHSIIVLFPYLLVQIVTRGGDWAIQNYLIYTVKSWLIFLPAVALGATFNVTSGYFLQKLLVFPTETSGPAPAMPNRFGTFVVLRVVYGAGAFLILTLLYVVWPEPYWIYSGIITLWMWLWSYRSQRAVFTGTLRKLPRVVRTTRVSVFQVPRKSKRLLRTLIGQQHKRVRA